jgi:signal transduction histidine kinase
VLNSIPCRFESNCDKTILTTEIKIDFFRICQEAFMNIMFHAQASQVIVILEEKEDKICLSVIDDGVGFDIHQEKDSPGLTIMRERAASVNAQLKIESVIGKGTCISVCIEK